MQDASKPLLPCIPRLRRFARAAVWHHAQHACRSDPQAKPSQTHGLEICDVEYSSRQLSTEQRAILLLVALEEMTYDEVAASSATN